MTSIGLLAVKLVSTSRSTHSPRLHAEHHYYGLTAECSAQRGEIPGMPRQGVVRAKGKGARVELYS